MLKNIEKFSRHFFKYIIGNKIYLISLIITSSFLLATILFTTIYDILPALKCGFSLRRMSQQSSIHPLDFARGFFERCYRNRILPNIYVSEFYVGGLTKNEAQSLLSSKISIPENLKIIADGQEFEISLSDINFSYDFAGTANSAFEISRSRLFNPISLIKSSVTVIKPVYKYDQQKLEEEISQISDITNSSPVFPYLYFKGGQLLLDKGKPGSKIENNEIVPKIRYYLDRLTFSPITINSTKIEVSLDKKEEEIFLNRGKSFAGKSLIFKIEDSLFSYKDKDLVKMLGPNKGYYSQEIEKVVEEVAGQVNRDPENSVFIFDEGKVKEFVPSKEGFKVKNDLLSQQIINSLNLLEKGADEKIEIEIPTEVTEPQISTKDINNLGIIELIGIGRSKFAGSILSRIHNINLASSKFNGVLIPPGEIMSFNKILGDVSKFTGYQEAYIIKDGKTILGDGGGVCQVSTTFFRAALNAGLPIVERRAHSYRVAYYEQGFPPGLDATVFDPTTDLKIKNDTPGHLLVQTKIDVSKKTLEFDIYGTNDGRIASTSKPVVSAVTPPPEDLYIDDPTLPVGQIKQIDYKAAGAKVYFNYKVEKDGIVTIDKNFYSNYQPWQAKFLRGTGTST